MSEESKPNEATPKAPLPPREERRARSFIGVGAASLFAGITLAVTDDDWGRWLIVLGIALLFVALHRFGRLGPEDAHV